MPDEVTYDDFVDALAKHSLFEPAGDEEDSDAWRAYWESVKQYTLRLNEFYSVSKKGAKFLDGAITKRFSLKDKGYLELMKCKLEMSRIYQTVSTAYNINLTRNFNFDEYYLVVKLYQSDTFSKFVESFYKHILATLKQLTDEADQRIQELNLVEAQNFLERIRSTSQDLLGQLDRKAADVDAVLTQAQKQSSEASELLKEAQKQSEEASTALNTATETSDGARKAADSVLTNVLTILGIFVALIVAFVSGFFSVLLADRSNISPIPQVCLVHFLLMAHVLFNLIFLFMFMISRLSYKSISVLCLYSDDKKHLGECQFCKCNCEWYKRLWRKYPYLVLTNLAIIVGYVVLFLWWFIDEFVYSHFETVLHESQRASIGTLIIILILLISIILVPYLIACHKKKSS